MSARPEVPRQLRQLWVTRFDFLAGALPGREAPTDIDLAVEKNGHFLFIECKRPRQPVCRGQHIFFERLAALPRCRVLVVNGQPPDGVVSYAWWGREPVDADVYAVRALVRRWRDWAAAQ